MKTELGKIAEIITGPFGSALHQYEYVKNGVSVIMPQDIQDRKLSYTKIAFITPQKAAELTRYTVKKNDIVYARRGDVEKHAFITSADEGSICGTGCLRVRCKATAVNPLFLSFYLNKPESRQWITKHAVGSNMPNINSEILGALPIEIADNVDQGKVAAFLESLDLIIANNTAICAELEAMAKLIYDYWFVQFDFPDEHGRPYKSSGGAMVWNDALHREIPAGWGDGNLYDIADFINGLPCQNYRPIDEKHKLPVIKIGEMHKGIGNDVEWARDDVPEKNIIDNGDILFSWSATLEVMFWNMGKGVLNQHIFKVIPKEYSKYYVYQQLTQYVVNFVRMAEARKTTMGHITTDHLKQSRIALPPRMLVELYENFVKDSFEKILNCSAENQQLAALRDFLLPLLMNDQVTVCEPEKTAP